jgi:chromosome segregation ATPase
MLVYSITMMFIITAVIVALLSSALIFGAYNTVAGRAVASVTNELKRLTTESSELEKKLTELTRYKDGYFSRAQFENANGKLKKIKDEIDKERASLKDFEGRLDTAQQAVEGKEAHQQELKSSREEDEIKLEEILSGYQDLSAESIALEQQVAQSMKNLEAILGEVTLTDGQRAILDDLNETLSRAGESLRNLITEFEGVNNRLNLLKEQHEDLEEEYTKLVEQQLGD